MPYCVPPILTNKPSYIWPTTLLICFTYLRHCNHLCYFWAIVFDVMMEDNHALNTEENHALNTEEGDRMCSRKESRNLCLQKGSVMRLVSANLQKT